MFDLTRLRKDSRLLLIAVLLLLAVAGAASGQTTSFTYQGRLTDGGTPANGNYDLQFALFDSASNGNQIGSTQTISTVSVSSGIFTVTLDFGPNAFSGATRFLEISARLSGGGSFTLLSPRQQITSTPYAVRSLNAGTADTATTATTATNATQLGGVAASSYVQTNDSRLTDARPPTASSSSYVQNTNSPQAGSNFNISGNGTAGGTLSGDIINANTQYNIGGSRVLTTAGTNNIFAGSGAGSVNTGIENSFFGFNAGNANTTAGGNSFFGSRAGSADTTGDANSFFGAHAGRDTTTGNANSFFGADAGRANTSGFFNSFFGSAAGLVNTTGGGNAFFGIGAGQANTTADRNSFFGSFAGNKNTTGADNSFFGYGAGNANTTGIHNSFFGGFAGNANTTGNDSTFFGYIAGVSNTTGGANSFFGTSAGVFNTTGAVNSFFGRNAGNLNTTGSDNSFFGGLAGNANTVGAANSFFGRSAGVNNTTGANNSFFGISAGVSNTAEDRNTFVGANANGMAGIVNATAIGANASVAQSNSLVLGSIAGVNGATDSVNVGIGTNVPEQSLSVAGGILVDQTNQNTGTSGPAFALTFGHASGEGIASKRNAGGNQYGLDFYTKFLNRMSITQAGNVGIGTTSPAHQLSIIGGPLWTMAGWVGSLELANGSAIAWRSNNAGNRFGIGHTDGGLFLFTTPSDPGTTGSPSIYQLTINDNGNVGIGTSLAPPPVKLQVVGDIRVGASGTNGCVQRFDGTAIAGACSSDIRFKRDIRAFPNLLNRLTKLQPVHYYWRTSEYPERHFGDSQSYGLVAQEVERVLPELVGEDAQGYKTIDYSKLPLMMLQAIKEQQAQIEQQQNQLRQQQVQIDGLRKLICRQHREAVVCQ